MTSSIRAGSIRARSINALMAMAARSSGRMPANAPAARPTGVRTASTISASVTGSRLAPQLVPNARDALEFFEWQVRAGINDHQAFAGDVDDREIGVDAVDARDAGERIAAALDDLAVAPPGQVVHHDEDPLGADGQVHGAADGGN